MEKEMGEKLRIDSSGRLLLFGQPVGIIHEDDAGRRDAVVDSGYQMLEVNRFLLPQCHKVRFETGVAKRMEQTAATDGPATTRIRVHQLRPETEPELKFIGYRDMMRRNGGVDRSQYIQVFDGDVGSDDPETVYELLRERPPPGYSGHSLTRSDVLELYGPSQSQCYFIDTYALQPIEFSEGQGETMDIRMERG